MLGTSLLVVTGFLLALNIALIVVQVSKKLYAKARKRHHRRQREKEMLKKLEIEHAAEHAARLQEEANEKQAWH